VGQVRASRAKTKHGQHAGRVNGSAIGSTEGAAGRRFAAARTAPGSTDRARAILQQVDIALAGHTEGTKSGGIRNTFEAVPDAPVTRFTLQLKGGRKSLLENHVTLCARKHRADAVFTGHNGKLFESKPVVAVSCKKGKHKH
jgi:hypothetical protein